MLTVKNCHFVNNGIIKLSGYISVRNASYSKAKIQNPGLDSFLTLREFNTPAHFQISKPLTKKSSNEPFEIPDHKYPYTANPLLKACNGDYISQKINYNEILPRCKGKLNKLEWVHLNEEDRYTKRNWAIRAFQKEVKVTKHFGQDRVADPIIAYNIQFVVLALAVFFWYHGLPGTNSRSLKSIDPDDMSVIGKSKQHLLSIPIIGDIIYYITSGTLDRIAVPTVVTRYPLWTEAETGESVRIISQQKAEELSSNFYFNIRDNSIVSHVPTESFTEENKLYFDDVDGPDRIGNYNVYPWKEGKVTLNAKLNGDTSQGGNSQASPIFTCGR